MVYIVDTKLANSNLPVYCRMWSDESEQPELINRTAAVCENRTGVCGQGLCGPLYCDTELAMGKGMSKWLDRIDSYIFYVTNILNHLGMWVIEMVSELLR